MSVNCKENYYIARTILSSLRQCFASHFQIVMRNEYFLYELNRGSVSTLRKNTEAKFLYSVSYRAKNVFSLRNNTKGSVFFRTERVMKFSLDAHLKGVDISDNLNI